MLKFPISHLTLLLITFGGIAPVVAVRTPAGDQHVAQIQKLVERGQLDAAEKQIWDIVSQEPENAAALSLLGTIRMRQKRLPEAEALFERVLTIDANATEAYRSLGEIYSSTERDEDAKAVYKKAHELSPLDPKISLELAEAYQKTGEFQLSAETINSIPPASRPSAALPILASDYFGLKQPGKVAALAPLVRQSASSDIKLVPNFARVLALNGYVDDAAELLSSATPRVRSSSEYLLVMARVQELQGDPGKAERTLLRAKSLFPDSFEALIQLARLASQAKDFKKEADYLENALTVQPKNVEALRHIVLARMRAGEGGPAVDAARQLYSLRPDDPDALYLLGAALVNHAEFHEARPLMEKLVFVRDDATNHMLLGMTLLNDGDMDAASQQIAIALQKDPNQAEAHYYKGVIARQRGDLPGALAEMKIVVGLNPKHALAQQDLGTMELSNGNLEPARKALEQAAALQPEVPENHYQLALAYGRLGLLDKAKAEMIEFRKLKDASDRNRARSQSPPPAIPDSKPQP